LGTHPLCQWTGRCFHIFSSVVKQIHDGFFCYRTLSF
jgi:hypothetical protein